MSISHRLVPEFEFSGRVVERRSDTIDVMTCLSVLNFSTYPHFTLNSLIKLNSCSLGGGKKEFRDLSRTMT